MPWAYVEPDEFCSTEDGTVVYYCTNRHGAWMDWHYQIESEEKGWVAFDVRDLARNIHFNSPSESREKHQEIIEVASTLVNSLEEMLKQTGIWHEGETR